MTKMALKQVGFFIQSCNHMAQGNDQFKNVGLLQPAKMISYNPVKLFMNMVTGKESMRNCIMKECSFTSRCI